MPGKAVGWAAVELPWLCPNTDSLIGLAEHPAAVASQVATDPALLMFLVRFAGYTGERADTHVFQSSSLPYTAATYLAHAPVGWLDPMDPVIVRLATFRAIAANLARSLAEKARYSAPEVAATTAQLAPLGWYAVVAVNPRAARECLAEPTFRLHPADTQTRSWGLDHDSIARRLAARWELPQQIATAIGNLTLPLRGVRPVIADPILFAIVQLAVHEAELRAGELGLTRHIERAELLAQLRIDEATCEDAFRVSFHIPTPVISSLDPDPRRVPLIRNLLLMAVRARRRSSAALIARLEERADSMHKALAELTRRTDERVRDARLAGLAELAAGAGHEINNPLAVISGLAQSLVRVEPDPERGESFRAIIRQTQRIHGILRELMQFARPSRPTPQITSASDLMTLVRDEVNPLAVERGVKIELDSVEGAEPVWVAVDPKQIRQALVAVVRNAIEAAPREGWVRMVCEAGGRFVGFAVEDSGPGMSEDIVERVFDPFFCGRSAGRGRGLGLSTAWRLARENGGDVRYEPAAGGPTRFVVVVPRSAPNTDQSDRKCA